MVRNAWIAGLLVLAGLCASAIQAVAAEPPKTVHVLYLQQQVERGPVLSNLAAQPDDLGLQGARLGIADTNTTGKFTKQAFDLTEVVAPDLPETKCEAFRKGND